MRPPLHALRFRRDHRWVPSRASDYLDGALQARERTRAARHLQECPQCRDLLRSLQAIISTLGTLRGEDGGLVASSVLASVQSRLGALPRDGA